MGDVNFRLLHGGSVTQAVLEDLKGRERNRAVMTVTALQRNVRKRGMAYTRHQIIKVLQNLEKAGAGRFIVGRRGMPSRFVWEIPATEFAKEARKMQRRKSVAA